MSLGLTNARLSMGTRRLRTQKVAPARTSIAEDAKFIPKPRKRVSFKLMGGNGANIGQGQLGKNGLTAQFNDSAYQGRPAMVVMEINRNPQKDYSVIATQEEGRQTNRAAQTHYTQQYDSYGRPIIGFSREPYDFAAAKYISMTSQIKFQENVEKTRELNNERNTESLNGDVYDLAMQEMKFLGDRSPGEQGVIDPKPDVSDLPGTGQPGAGQLPNSKMIDYDPKDIKLPGSGSVPTQGMIDADEAAKPQFKTDGNANSESVAVKTTGKSAREVAEMMGIEIMKAAKSADVETTANLHKLKEVSQPSTVSLSV